MRPASMFLPVEFYGNFYSVTPVCGHLVASHAGELMSILLIAVNIQNYRVPTKGVPRSPLFRY
jgi:hypothetical protein